MIARAITGYVLLYMIVAAVVLSVAAFGGHQRRLARPGLWGWVCREDGCRVEGEEPSEVQARRAFERHYQREHYRPYLPAPRAYGSTRRPA